MWVITVQYSTVGSWRRWNHKVGVGEKVVSKVCMCSCWACGFCGPWAGWITLSPNIRDIFYYLLVNTPPPTMSTTDRSLQQATGLHCSMTEAHWLLALITGFHEGSVSHKLWTITGTRARTLSRFNESGWPLNPTIQSLLLWRRV